MTKPLISVIVPILNGAPFVDIFYQSVTLQTWPSWELIVVDGGSTDAGPDRIRAIMQTDPRVRFYSQDGMKNRGIAAARNLGVHYAEGDYLSFLDCDNTWSPDKLDAQFHVSVVHGVDVVYGPETVEVEQGLDLGILNGHTYKMTPGRHVVGSMIAKWISGEETHPQASDVLMTRESFDGCGGFVEDFWPEEYTEEVAWACVVGALYDVFCMTEPRVIHYLHSGSCTASAIRRGVANANADRVRMWLSGWFAGRGLSAYREVCSSPHLLG